MFISKYIRYKIIREKILREKSYIPTLTFVSY